MRKMRLKKERKYVGVLGQASELPDTAIQYLRPYNHIYTPCNLRELYRTVVLILAGDLP
jgi:hypothetical protein